MVDTTACHKMLLIFDNVTNSAQPEISWNLRFLIAPTFYSKTCELVRSFVIATRYLKSFTEFKWHSKTKSLLNTE